MYKNLVFIMLCLINFSGLAQPVIIAHRGSSFTAPENTVAAAKLAWQQNADAVECDIYLSKDNRVVVIHDSNTKRTTGQDHKIAETNSEMLRTLDAGSWKNEQYKGEKIPYLEEIIATVPEGKKLVIEIKCGIEVLPALKAVVNQSGKKKQMIFIAFGWETIVATKKLFPKNDCYWLSSSIADVQARLNEKDIRKLDGINLGYKIIDEKIALQTKSKKLDLLAWTVDDPQEAKRLDALGVKAITTNKPDLIREILEMK
jgi:glycerophosphoryl diester phosphodiesterase